MKSQGRGPRYVDNTGRLEAWFAWETKEDSQKSIDAYLTTYSRKIVNIPKFVRLEWLEEQQLHGVCELLEFQGLKRFLGLTGNIYLDLTKVFFTNLKVKDEKIESRVKGMRMLVSSVKWEAVTGLNYKGLKIGKENTEELDDYNKITFYRSCLRNPQAVTRGFQVEGLSLIPRLIAFIVVWIITPRGHNHAVLYEEDLILMYCIINRIKVNWPYVIAEEMEKAKRLPDYRLPYVVLISKFHQNFLIPLEGELEEPVKQACEIFKSTLNKIGLTQDNNGRWITQGEAENEEQAEEVAGEDAGLAEHEAAGGEAGQGSGYSKFEQMMIDKLDNLTMEQKNNHEFYTARFQHLDHQMEVVQDQLATMAAWNQPHE